MEFVDRTCSDRHHQTFAVQPQQPTKKFQSVLHFISAGCCAAEEKELQRATPEAATSLYNVAAGCIIQ
jgi:hypothetical protein